MPLNSMQSTLRKFHKWMEKNMDRFSQEFFIAQDLFFAEREGLASVNKTDQFLEVFQEWLITDFPVHGFVQPAKNRKNFLQYFLKEESKNLTTAEKIFGKNLQKSCRSFYHVESVEKGMWVDLKETFSGKKLQMWDVNISKKLKKGDIIFARVVQNEKEKYIGGGVNAEVIPSQMFQILKEMIVLTHKNTIGTSDESSFKEFFKWNSYIYIRDIHNPKDLLASVS